MPSMPLFVEPPPLPAALLAEITDIVFGSTPQPIACTLLFIFGGTNPRAIDAAHDAYRRGLAPRILVTGGIRHDRYFDAKWNGRGFSEAHVVVQSLLELGVPSTDVVYEERSTNSLENVLCGLEALNFRDFPSVMCVCKSYAAGRQCRTIAKYVSKTTAIVPYTYEAQIEGSGPMIDRSNWHRWPAASSLVYSNLLKIVHYGSLGHLQPVTGMSAELARLMEESLTRLKEQTADRPARS